MSDYAFGASNTSPLDWRKSSFSWANSDCVEVACGSGGVVRVRDTKNSAGTVLAFDRTQWTAFVGDIGSGRGRR